MPAASKTTTKKATTKKAAAAPVVASPVVAAEPTLTDEERSDLAAKFEAAVAGAVADAPEPVAQLAPLVASTAAWPRSVGAYAKAIVPAFASAAYALEAALEDMHVSASEWGTIGAGLLLSVLIALVPNASKSDT